MATEDSHIEILGVPVARSDLYEALRRIALFLKTPGVKHVATVNPEYVMQASRDPGFLQLLKQTDLNVPDGIGIIWASMLLGRRLKRRVTGTDLLPLICGLCSRKGYRVFLLGGKPGVAERAAGNLSRQFPGLAVAGTSSNDPGPESDPETVEEINRSGAEVLAVAYGCPKQDFWILENREKLTGVRVAIGVGGALDFISGELPRAPLPVRKAGLEWLFRLWLEPGRFWRMAALPRFGWRVLKSRWGTGNNAPPAGPD